MTRVNLDTQPEVIRQFVLALSASGDGTVLESAGRPVACIVPPPSSSEAGTPEEEWTDEKNRRRCELIDRKYGHGLSAAEEAELALLQNAMHRFIDRVAPLPLDLPGGNSRPDGVVRSHLARQQRGELPETY
jgi:hypothetical protein